MKRRFLTCTAFVAIIALSACSKDCVLQNKQYQEEIQDALNSGDSEKYEKVLREYLEWIQGLSKEEQQRIVNEGMVKIMKNINFPE